jgi:hypothetical protein
MSMLFALLLVLGSAAIDASLAQTAADPPIGHIPEQVTAELSAAGYSLVASHAFLSRQYFLVFEGKAS